MKQRCLALCSAVFLAIALEGCVPGDSGGGGGLGSFSRGFAFVRDHGIYLVDDSDRSASQPIALATTGDNRNPSLSKDGRRVVFVRGGAELWVVNASNGATPAQVPIQLSSISDIRTPVFSPDGNTIVFAYSQSGLSPLGIVNVDGTGFRQVTTPSPFYYTGPSFYADGQSVLAAKGSSPGFYTQLVRVNLSTGAEAVVANLPLGQACAIANRAVLSPDGGKIAFDARNFSSGGVCSGSVRIFVVNLAAQTINRLTNYLAEPGATDGFPTWVGGAQVGYSSDAGSGSNNVYSLDASVADQSGVLRVPTASEPSYGPN